MDANHRLRKRLEIIAMSVAVITLLAMLMAMPALRSGQVAAR